MLALVEDMPEQPLASERALPIEDAVVHRPTARPRIENIQETPQQPVSLYSNATTTTARLLFPGDEVFRSFIGCRERPTTFPWLHQDKCRHGPGGCREHVLRDTSRGGLQRHSRPPKPLGTFPQHGKKNGTQTTDASQGTVTSDTDFFLPPRFLLI